MAIKGNYPRKMTPPAILAGSMMPRLLNGNSADTENEGVRHSSLQLQQVS